MLFGFDRWSLNVSCLPLRPRLIVRINVRINLGKNVIMFARSFSSLFLHLKKKIKILGKILKLLRFKRWIYVSKGSNTSLMVWTFVPNLGKCRRNVMTGRAMRWQERAMEKRTFSRGNRKGYEKCQNLFLS